MEALRLLGGRYRLEDQIGTGGMAVVWRATDEVLRRPVAVKVLAGRMTTDPGARLRIQAEARSAARLSHPHVCGVFDYGETTDSFGRPEPFVVMELLRGPTLSERIADGPLPPHEAMRVCAEVASGVAAAHDVGLVHRDIKPANVILTSRGAKVVDFGIAAAAGPLEDLEQDDRLVGTPAYLAPERLTGDHVVPASDVYALGLLVHYVLVGRLPWAAETTTQMLRAHTYTEPEPLPSVIGVPAEVVELCDRCLAKDPADRPTAVEVADILARAAGVVVRPAAGPAGLVVEPPAGLAVGARSMVDGPTLAPVGIRRRQRTLAVGVGAATVVATVVVAALIAGPGGGTRGALAQLLPSGPKTADTGGSTTATTPPGEQTDGTPRRGDGPRPGQTSAGPTPTPTASGTPTSGPPGDQQFPEPTGPEPTPSIVQSPDPTPGDEGGTNTRTLGSAGGEVDATCQIDGLVKVLEVRPAEGYKVTKEERGPAPKVRVWFEGPTEVHVRIRCKKQVPTLVNEG